MVKGAPPEWDDTAAQALIGGVVLIGLTYVNGDAYEQRQLNRVIAEAVAGRGV